MAFSFFLNKNRRLRNIWWVVVFFLVLAAITFPVIILSQQYKFEITILCQAFIVITASVIHHCFFYFLIMHKIFFRKRIEQDDYGVELHLDEVSSKSFFFSIPKLH